VIGVLGAIALFLVQFTLIAFLLARAIFVPATLLVVEPTQLARRFLRRLRGEQSKAFFEINVDAKDLQQILNGWQATTFVIALCVIGFLLEHHVAYLMLGVAFALPRLTASSEPVDERSFERFTRTLGAVSDAVIIGTLFLAMIFRPTLSAFGLLAFMFMAREVLLVLARRWLDAEPEFEAHDEKTSPTIALHGGASDEDSGVPGNPQP
jgi:hypothetical protein